MCDYCRDLRPKECPACTEQAQGELQALALTTDEFMMMDIHDELFRQEGEPIEAS